MVRTQKFDNSFLVQLDRRDNGETVMDWVLSLKGLHEGDLTDRLVDMGALKVDDHTLVASNFVTLQGELVEHEVELDVFVNGVLVESLEHQLDF